MILAIVSFLSGMLTVLAPCVLPLLPIIVGGTLKGEARDKARPFIIAGSLAVAVVLFTLVLKVSTSLIAIPASVWTTISGGIIIIFGLVSVFPHWWEKISIQLNLLGRSNALLQRSADKKTRFGEILLGMSLGPVFSSCSPVYFVILATVLPQQFLAGLVYLIIYALGLATSLLLIGLLGQQVVKRARFLADANGWFKRGLGIVFIMVGIGILTGVDKNIQTYVASHNFFDITQVEQSLLRWSNSTRAELPIIPSSVSPVTNNSPSSIFGRTVDASSENSMRIRLEKQSQYPRYVEIAKPSGFVNSDSLTLGQFVGKKVILVDFMTYSCINCQRTFPYLNAWYAAYKDQGLEVIAIHTPEFSFEKKIENVREAMKREGITFPVVLDNDYGTWNAYANQYWPRKYLIDIDGFVVYDHIGEGNYDETEAKIQELLAERMIRLGEKNNLNTGVVHPTNTVSRIDADSPETYFGSARNELLANGKALTAGTQTLTRVDQIKRNQLYLTGSWRFTDEYAENQSAGATIQYRFQAKAMYLVARADKETLVEVRLDGASLTAKNAGKDVLFKDGKSFVRVKADALYQLLNEPDEKKEHVLEMVVPVAGVQVFTFTFG